MLHLIPARQQRSSDDPIFALHAEARSRKARGESIVDATVGVLLEEDGRLAILPSAARAVREVPDVERLVDAFPTRRAGKGRRISTASKPSLLGAH